MLTETGLELAQKLVHAENSMSGSSPEHISTEIGQNSKQDFVPCTVMNRKSDFVTQEIVEDSESRLPRPWLLSQEDGHLNNGSKISSISSEEVIPSDRHPPLDSEGTSSPINYTSLPVLASNPVLHNSVQSDELRYKNGGLMCVFTLFL